MGARGPHQQSHCHRGHQLAGANVKPQRTGRRCRACECAISWAWCWEHRQGVTVSPEEVQQYADWKFAQLMSVVPA